MSPHQGPALKFETLPMEASESNRLREKLLNRKYREGRDGEIFPLLVFIRFLNVTSLWVKFNIESGTNIATSYL